MKKNLIPIIVIVVFFLIVALVADAMLRGPLGSVPVPVPVPGHTDVVEPVETDDLGLVYVSPLPETTVIPTVEPTEPIEFAEEIDVTYIDSSNAALRTHPYSVETIPPPTIMPEILHPDYYLFWTKCTVCATSSAPMYNDAGVIIGFLPAGTLLWQEPKSTDAVVPLERVKVSTKVDDDFYMDLHDLQDGWYYLVSDRGVDLRHYLDYAEFDLLFATYRNVVGKPLFPGIPMLEEETAAHLKKAEEIFAEDGYRMKIYDAYRPYYSQTAIWEAIHDSRFAAKPDTFGSYHNHGLAVALTLVDMETGEALEFPTKVYEYDSMATYKMYDYWSEEARHNVDYLKQVMMDCGFRILGTEWWYFDYPSSYEMPMWFSYESLEYEPYDDDLEMDVPSIVPFLMDYHE